MSGGSLRAVAFAIRPTITCWGTTMADDLELRIAKLTFAPGDVLVAKWNGIIQHEVADQMRAGLKPLLPEGVRLLVIDDRVDLYVLTSADIEARTNPPSHHATCPARVGGRCNCAKECPMEDCIKPSGHDGFHVRKTADSVGQGIERLNRKAPT